MELFGINVIEHPDMEEGQAWIVFKKDAPQVPQELRDKLSVPCILTSNLALTERMLTLLQAISNGMQ